MRFLSVNKSTEANIFGQHYSLEPLDPQKENIEDILVTDNFSAAELLERHRQVLLNIQFETRRMPRFPKPVRRLSDMGTTGTCLIMRNGGIGDHVQFLPFLHVLRQRISAGISLWLAAQKEKHPIYETNPNIDRLLPLPLRLDEVLKADYLIDFSENDDWCDLEHVTMTDGYFRFLGIDDQTIEDKRPVMAWPSGRSPEVSKIFESVATGLHSKPTVLLNWTASNPLRTLPPQQLLSLTEAFKDVQFVVAQPRSHLNVTARVTADYDGLLDCTEKMTSLANYVEAISHCDAVVSTDTGTGHLAEALGKPSLILFGPTKDEIWIRYYTHTVPLRAEYTGKTCQSPCGLIKAEEKCPEAIRMEAPFSPCLLAISERRIREAFESLLKKVRER